MRRLSLPLTALTLLAVLAASPAQAQTAPVYGAALDAGATPAQAAGLSAAMRATTLEAKFAASDAADSGQFGISVSLSGDRALVGAPLGDGAASTSGAAYVFELTTVGTWAQTQKLAASDGETDDRFGYSVLLSGDHALVGAPYDDDGFAESGSAYMFNLTEAGMWTQTQKLTASDSQTGDTFGWSVSVSGDHVLVGAPFHDGVVSSSGSAYVFSAPRPVAMVTLDGAEGWRTLASPDSTTIGDFLDTLWTQGFGGADNAAGDCSVFNYDETAASLDEGWVCVSDATDVLAPGQGIMVYVFADDDPTTAGIQGGAEDGFPKTLSSSTAVQPSDSFSFAVAFTDDGRSLDQKGWNLLGTPAGTAFDWSQVQRTGVGSTVYVYDPAVKSYRTYTIEGVTSSGDLDGGIVPPFQGFFAKAAAPSPSLVLTAAAAQYGRDVYGRQAMDTPPAPPATPLQKVTPAATASDDGRQEVTALGMVAPNPSAGGARVAWTLAEASDVRVSVTDLLGREVAVLADGAFAAGPQRAEIGAGLAPGVYLVRLQAGATVEASRFTVVR